MITAYHFIIDFDVAHSDCDCLVKSLIHFIKDLSYSPRDNASVLVVLAAATHSEGLSCACLPITQYGSIVTLHHRSHCLISTRLVDFILTTFRDQY